jgi:2-oxoglutarate dehydrogenase E1 component
MPLHQDFTGLNAAYVLQVYERFMADPASVDPSWRSHFATNGPPGDAAPAEAAGAPSLDVRRVVGAHELAEAIRARGHTAARLDPLGAPGGEDPALRSETHGISATDLEQLPPDVVDGPQARGARNAAQAIERLRGVYAGTIGYEFEHIQDPEARAWLREAVETGRYREPLDAEARRGLLRRLSQVEGFERFLHRAFVGQKRFSVEGTDTLIPLLDEIIARAAAARTREVIIGMAHRGRLNVLAHVMGKPYENILSGFQGARPAEEPASDFKGSELSGDVKYHMGWRGSLQGTETVKVTLSPNPSHLEFVNPVVIGMTRAAQDDTARTGPPTLDTRSALPILVHGDSAFPGQGVVAETLNMVCLRGYAVGGAIHVIVNNQIGFTTVPGDARSTRYASDLAKGFEIPVLHVNADDVEACVAVARIAQDYRDLFGKDVVIDLIGYRRWGHNEGDEPTFTQPRMYEAIRSHPTAREQWAERLVRDGVVSAEEADAMVTEVNDRLSAVLDSLGGKGTGRGSDAAHPPGRAPQEPETALPASALEEINEALLAWPEDFSPNPRLARMLERRREALRDRSIDWGHAETLAFASLLREGVPVRLTGQDAERGTFSHRHLVLHDSVTGRQHTPVASVTGARASFEVHNSPLSEMAVLGFEYGYSVRDPEVLVVWEAQFGDFVNGAQVIIDQFLAAAEQKWEQTSGLVLLLPHGHEGQGPEHSSARLERFLQLAAERNLRVANCTTSAQYFHLLRRQAALRNADARPLVVMSPKSLLRHPLAACSLEDLSEGRFHRVLGDPEAAARAGEVTRLLLCSGKLYVDLVSAEARNTASRVALARVEELYPFPVEELRDLVASFPELQEIVWVQEEPRNMGAWFYMEPRLRDLADGKLDLRYVGRPERASPAEGKTEMHQEGQRRIVATAWDGAPAPARRRKALRA